MAKFSSATFLPTADTEGIVSLISSLTSTDLESLTATQSQAVGGAVPYLTDGRQS
jgi:hypothetical protein